MPLQVCFRLFVWLCAHEVNVWEAKKRTGKVSLLCHYIDVLTWERMSQHMEIKGQLGRVSASLHVDSRNRTHVLKLGYEHPHPRAMLLALSACARCLARQAVSS